MNSLAISSLSTFRSQIWCNFIRWLLHAGYWFGLTSMVLHRCLKITSFNLYALNRFKITTQIVIITTGYRINQTLIYGNKVFLNEYIMNPSKSDCRSIFFINNNNFWFLLINIALAKQDAYCAWTTNVFGSSRTKWLDQVHRRLLGPLLKEVKNMLNCAAKRVSEEAGRLKFFRRYRDDFTSLNIDNFMILAGEIYPPSLSLTQETRIEVKWMC